MPFDYSILITYFDSPNHHHNSIPMTNTNPNPTRVEEIFRAGIDALESARDALPPVVTKAAVSLISALQNGGKILLCGNGGSASDSLHFSSELLNKFHHPRRPLPAVSLVADVSTLTSVANDESYQEVFAKQVRALGTPQDRLVVITTSGNSPSILQAVHAAHEKKIACIALNGKGGGALSPLLRTDANDIDIIVPSDSTARIQEVHGIIIHIFCQMIDQVFAEENAS